ncbi:MAG: hypothetical protein HN352_14445 [Bacteroidetes bacterium]|jgi:uncharacterized protein (TIGR02145 family)|nr:hypothetical protein [Bacteroidota bacterium]MBT3748986.1 hypothetical protein [Bacteroidota bacterium]MBT4398426.1 hypothetical protein [Bacteroidota bacterium]MBT4409597.1 hypothetical protein [Bacteroidota bacterium]MBT7094548.1 hypothetical protein [Bacteroidota bacterium]
MTSFSVVGGEGFYGRHYAGMAAQNSCPEGWHLPSDEEWIDLERYLGINEDELYLSGAGRAAGLDDKIKASFDWDEPIANPNSTGFGALPAGYWFSERSYNWGFYGHYTAFWSWNEADNIKSFGRSMSHERDEIRRTIPLSSSLSARCLRAY